jgi:plastocyanin
VTHRTPAARRLALGAAAAVTLLILTACGGSDDSGDSDAGATVTTESTPTQSSEPPDSGQSSASPSAGEQEAESITATEANFTITLDEDSFAAGAYEIQVVNQGSATHNLVVQRDGEDVAASDAIGPGGSTTLAVTLDPGEYVFYCSIGNHRAMGMELTVQVT